MTADTSSTLVSRAYLAGPSLDANATIPVTVVGYGHYRHRNDPCNKGLRLYWIVQNSWGTQAGYGGYMYSMWRYIQSPLPTTHLLYSRVRKLGEHGMVVLLQREGMSCLQDTQRTS
jgi:C1A family cysteine protease